MLAQAAVLDVMPNSKLAIPLEERLIVALDVPTVEQAYVIVQKIGSAASFYKIGLQLQFAGGIELAKRLISERKKVFLDSKILDIDQTVTNAVANIAKLGVSFLTVHGNGPTIRAAIEGRGNRDLKILSVTALTTLDAHDMADLGLSCSVEELVMMRAQKALSAGCDGVIASGQEARKIRAMAGNRLLILTPGVRSDGIPKDDQKRVATPREAIAAGADYLVVGREILRSADPAAAAQAILRQIESALSG
jgi:orotidine-5'-phosphate decarboxylase